MKATLCVNQRGLQIFAMIIQHKIIHKHLIAFFVTFLCLIGSQATFAQTEAQEFKDQQRQWAKLMAVVQPGAPDAQSSNHVQVLLDIFTAVGTGSSHDYRPRIPHEYHERAYDIVLQALATSMQEHGIDTKTTNADSYAQYLLRTRKAKQLPGSWQDKTGIIQSAISKVERHCIHTFADKIDTGSVLEMDRAGSGYFGPADDMLIATRLVSGLRRSAAKTIVEDIATRLQEAPTTQQQKHAHALTALKFFCEPSLVEHIDPDLWYRSMEITLRTLEKAKDAKLEYLASAILLHITFFRSDMLHTQKERLGKISAALQNTLDKKMSTDDALDLEITNAQHETLTNLRVALLLSLKIDDFIRLDSTRNKIDALFRDARAFKGIREIDFIDLLRGRLTGRYVRAVDFTIDMLNKYGAPEIVPDFVSFYVKNVRLTKTRYSP